MKHLSWGFVCTALFASPAIAQTYSITGPASFTLNVNPDGSAKTQVLHYWKLRKDGVQIAPRQAIWSISTETGNVNATISIGGMVTYKGATTPTARVRINAVYLGRNLVGYTDVKVSGLPVTTPPTPTPTDPTPPPPPPPQPGTDPVVVAPMDYKPSLGSNGLTPDPFVWSGRKWRAYVRSDDVSLDYPLRYTNKRVRFELRPEDFTGTASTSRAELGGSYSEYPRLPNGVPLWGAMTFIHRGTNDTSGVHGQIHMGSTAGGSPALAFRRSSDGLNVLKITTNSQSGSGTTGSKTRATLTVTREAPHDLVYRVKLDPYHGSLTVWIDGVKVYDNPDLPIGHSNAEHYWNFGAYYSGGIKSTVVAEYGNHVYPSTVDLSARLASPMGWPAD